MVQPSSTSGPIDSVSPQSPQSPQSPLHYFSASPSQPGTSQVIGCPKTQAVSAPVFPVFAATFSTSSSSTSSASPSPVAKASVVNDQSMEADEAQAQALIEQERVAPEELSNIQMLIDRMGEGLVQDILNQMQDDPLQPPILFDEAVFRAFAYAEAGAVGVNILSRAAILVATGMLLNRIEEMVKAKEKAVESVEPQFQGKLNEDIGKLNKWLKAQKKEFNAQLKNSAGMSLLSVPRGTFAIARIINASSRTADVAGNVFIAASFAGEALRMHRASKGIKVHNQWVGMLQGETQTIQQIKGILEHQKQVTQSEINRILGGIRQKLSENFPNIHDILEEIRQGGLVPPENVSLQELREWCSNPQREVELNKIFTDRGRDLISEQIGDVFLNKKGFEIEAFFASIDEKLSGDSPDIPAIIAELKHSGLNVPPNLHDVAELKGWLAAIERRWEFNHAMQKREMLSVSLRNALKTLCHKKSSIDRGFLKFSLTRSKGRFAAACVLTALTITLKVLLYVGIGSVAAGLALTGYGMIAAIGISAIIGAVYLYVKKPHVFKTYANGLQLRLFFRNIPLAIQQYRRNYTVLKASKLFIQLKVLELSSQQNTGALEKTKDRLNNVERKIKKLDTSVKKMEAEVEDLQETIVEAGWKDFYRHLYARSVPQVEPKSAQEPLPSGKPKPLLKDPRIVPTTTEDAATILARHLLQDPAILQDQETQKLLIHVGINPGNMGGKFPVEVSQTLRTFFAMDEEDTVEIAKRQMKKMKAMQAEAENG